jgi:hypothetical protein
MAKTKSKRASAVEPASNANRDKAELYLQAIRKLHTVIEILDEIAPISGNPFDLSEETKSSIYSDGSHHIEAIQQLAMNWARAVAE